MRALRFLFGLVFLSGCRPEAPAPPPPADGSALTLEQVRVVEAIAALDSMRIARAATIGPDEEVDAATFERVCKPVGLRARQLGEEHGWTVRQIATRYRNPANAAGEDSVLVAEFAADPTLTDRWAEASHNGVPGQRYLRRIDVQGTCLACHGPRDERPRFVTETYPSDRAFGFEPGDLRGLYSVFVPASP